MSKRKFQARKRRSVARLPHRHRGHSIGFGAASWLQLSAVYFWPPPPGLGAHPGSCRQRDHLEALMANGASFAALMELAANPEYSAPMMAHLPARYVPVFAKGCMDAMLRTGPVRMQGAVDRGDGGTSSTGQRSSA
jgi:hypothetical protein